MNFESNISAPFIRRPVATTLLAIGVFLAGAVAFRFLPVAPLPQVEFPTVQVQAGLPGASPENMASSVATPLERQFGRIAGVTEMTSNSQLGNTNVVMQFDLNRNVESAARDVQGAINAARGQLPAGLPSSPSYRKVNPAEASILNLALTSTTAPRSRIYDAADSILAQKLSEIPGVGQVTLGGAARPAVRVEVNPGVLNSYGIGLERVRLALNTANANRPKGAVADPYRTWNIDASDQLFHAAEYAPLIVAWRGGSPVRLRDVAEVIDGEENTRSDGVTNGETSINVNIFRQPTANIIETVDRIRALLPQLRASIPPSIHLAVTLDRTTTIREGIHDIEFTLFISIALVVLVVFAFLRSPRATAIPSVAVPLSLVGTFAVMYLLGYSVDNLSLMALTISTGFVVDDAIVVIENISRYLEAGMKPLEAALRGSREISLTVLSMSSSLIAVFIPILLMGGIVGRIFREFAITLSVAIAVSLLVSLSVTPMMCARLLRPDTGRHGFVHRIAEGAFNGLRRFYEACLRAVLRHQPVVLAVTVLTVAASVYMYVIVPKGFFPQQDTGIIEGTLRGDQATSFQSMTKKMRTFEAIIRQDPAVDTVGAFIGGGGPSNVSRFTVQLKPLRERKLSAVQVVARLRTKLAPIAGANMFFNIHQDVRVGGRGGNAQFQYTLQAENLADLYHWAPIMLERLGRIRELRDVNSDQQTQGLQSSLVVDRDTAGRLGVSMQAIDATLNDAFGQRQVSNIYSSLNQYHVVLEVAPQFKEDPSALKDIYVESGAGKLVPLSSFTHYENTRTALAVNHQGQFPSITLSFNLAGGASLSDATRDIKDAERDAGMPASVHGSFQGTARAFQQSLASEPWLVLAALVTVYIVLGVLYESYIYPITILSTLPSAGVGAILAIYLFKADLDIVALIGIILLIGIVEKNAILMVDFAVQAERLEGKRPIEAVYEACVLRFRPILMTTMAALLGALPLAIGGGAGSELRKPLGITIVGGLILSQLLTLFTTPVVYLYLGRLQAKTAPVGGRGLVEQPAGD